MSSGTSVPSYISQYTLGANGALSSMTTPTVATGVSAVNITANSLGRYVYVTAVFYYVFQYTIGAMGSSHP